MHEQAAPERVHDVGDVAPTRAAVLRPIHAGEALFRLVVARAAGTEVVVSGEQRAVGQAHDTGAAEVGEGALRLILDLDVGHGASNHRTTGASVPRVAGRCDRAILVNWLP